MPTKYNLPLVTTHSDGPNTVLTPPSDKHQASPNLHIEVQLIVNKVLDIGRGIENEIMATNSTSTGGLDKILQTKLHEINGYLATEVNIEHARLQDRLDEYFRKNEQSDVIVQWKVNFVTKLEQQAVDLKLKTINHLVQLCIGN